MLFVSLSVLLTSALIAKGWAVAGRHAADMGSVSRQWLAAHNASQPASSQ
jgi:hypothetical protein